MTGRTATVLRAGALTTAQDGGRHGYRHLAVGTAGALDHEAAALANRLVGNDDAGRGNVAVTSEVVVTGDDVDRTERRPAGGGGCAVLETTFDGVTLRFDASAFVAVTGAECRLTVDGVVAAPATALAVPAGTTVDVGAAVTGLRSYVAVSGGFDVAPVLGSRSYDTLARLGPPPLRPGDVVALGAPGAVPPAVDVTPQRTLDAEVAVAAWIGPRHDWIDVAARAALFSAAWMVTPSSNRVALRLAGPPLHRRLTAELPSEGIVAGAVQVPPDGQPLVFLADHPTTGGYPVVAVVPEPWRSLLAQVRPGGTIRFRPQGPGWETVRS